MGWKDAGDAWGAKAWDWALLQEELKANSFDVVQQLAGVGPGVRLLDLACGSGLALQRAEARGAGCYGIDASQELLDIAALRAPNAVLHCGDMADLPFDDGLFDAVTVVNGVQYGSDDVLGETARVMKTGAGFAMAFWSDPLDFTEYFEAGRELSPPAPSAALKLTDPGVAEDLVGDAGLDVVERGEHDVVGLYRSMQDALDGLMSAGAVWAAIDHAGEEAVRSAFRDAIAPFTDDAGRVIMRAKVGHLLASKP